MTANIAGFDASVPLGPYVGGLKAAGVAFVGLGRSGPFLTGALVMVCALLLALRLPRRGTASARVS